MLQKTQGIVLHSLKYKDTSIIVDIYTEVSGRASIRDSKTKNQPRSFVTKLEFEPFIVKRRSTGKAKG